MWEVLDLKRWIGIGGYDMLHYVSNVTFWSSFGFRYNFPQQ